MNTSMELEYYRHMNRRDNPGGSGSATGVFGQLINIDEVADVVIGQAIITSLAGKRSERDGRPAYMARDRRAPDSAACGLA